MKYRIKWSFPISPPFSHQFNLPSKIPIITFPYSQIFYLFLSDGWDRVLQNWILCWTKLYFLIVLYKIGFCGQSENGINWINSIGVRFGSDATRKDVLCQPWWFAHVSATGDILYESLNIIINMKMLGIFLVVQLMIFCRTIIFLLGQESCVKKGEKDKPIKI